MINSEKVKAMEEAGKISSELMKELVKAVKPGLATIKLDQLAEKFMEQHHVKSAFLGFGGYPKNICVSINNEIVHGIPSNEKVIKEGDLVSIDLGVKYKGFNSDMAATVPVGNITEQEKMLLSATKDALDKVVREIKIGDRIGKIGRIIEETASQNNVKVIYELTGHGVGEKLHENPIVYNYGKDNQGPIIKEGLTVAVEPMFAIGSSDIKSSNQDEWTIITADGSKAAHFEHTLLITKKGCKILTK